MPAGGISCEHALAATRLPRGRVRLEDGVDKWVVAREFDIILVPVEVSAEDAGSPFAW